MSPFFHESDYGRRACLRAFGLLMLIGMTACGAADQQSEANPANPAIPQQTSAGSESEPTSMAQPPTLPARPTATMPTPALRPRPTAVPALPKPINPTAVLAAPAVTPSSAGGWPSYRNTQAGWSIAYPADWTIDQQGSEDSPFITTLRPASGAGITIVVQAGAPPAIRQSEKSNIICARVVVGRLTGTRCVDADKGTIATTLAGKRQTYVIATTGKGVDEQIYQRVLDSFVPGAG